MGHIRVTHQQVCVLEIDLAPLPGLTDLQLPLALLFFLPVAQDFFLALIFSTTGVP
jgi:hypothetical protein